jgi:acyl-CoA synthetase (AMP-forming)/AMP-acid ligase II
MKIYPADIDTIVERFDRTTDVCAFAVDDSIYGQNVGMGVVLAETDDGTIRALYRWMRIHLAEPKMPARWWIVDAIPRTSRGKINRDAVRVACMDRTPLDLPRIVSDGEHP